MAPKDYESLPQVAGPAGYICVLRDIDQDAWRIDGTDHPRSLVERVQAERERKFGLELISVLITDDLSASATELYEQHQASLSSEWFYFDPYQLQELRASSLQIDAYNSFYLARKQPSNVANVSPAKATRHAESTGGAARSGSGLARRRRVSLQPETSELSRIRSRRRRRLARAGWRDRVARNSPTPYTLSDRVIDLWMKYPGVLTIAIILMAMIFLTYLRANYDTDRSSGDQRRENTDVSQTQATATGTPLPTYYLVKHGLVHECPSLTCDLIGVLDAGSQVDTETIVTGSIVAGINQWIGFRYKGRRAYVHSSSLSLEPPGARTGKQPATFERGSTVVVTELAPVRTCVWQCKLVGRLSTGSEITVLGTVEGENIDGNDTWIRFAYKLKVAYIHSRNVASIE